MTTTNEFYKNELTNFKETIIDLVSQAFKQDGNVHPALFALSVKDENFELAVLANVGELLANSDTKEMAKEAMQNFAKERKPIVIAFAFEAKARKFDAEEYDPNNIPDDVEPKDVIVITFETYDLQSVVTWNIDSSNPDRVTMLLDVDQDWTEKTKGEGMFNDILQEDYSEIAEEIRKLMNN